MWKIRPRIVFRIRIKIKWLVELLCVCSVFVAANNPWDNNNDGGTPYRFDILPIPSTTEAIPMSIPLLSTTPSSVTDPSVSEAPSDPRIMQMLGMLNGKEKNWAFKKPGLFGSHNVNIKLGAQESIFCRLTKRQTVVMFSFCMQNNKGGQNQGWGQSTTPSSMGWGKPSPGWGQMMTKAPMQMGWGEEEEEEMEGGKKKKKGGKKKGKKKKKKKKGGKKKGGGKKKKGGKGGGGKGEESGGGWGQQDMENMEMQQQMMGTKGGWGLDMKNKDWGEQKKKGEDGNDADASNEQEDADDEGEDDSVEGDEGEESTTNSEEDEILGGTSQDDEYDPKNKFVSTQRPKLIIKAETPGSAMYMTESEYAKWEKENSFAQKDKVNAQELLHHHFYKKY